MCFYIYRPYGDKMRKRAFVAMTGASGTIYGASILRELENAQIETYACATKDALANANAETGKQYKNISEYLTSMGVKNTVILSEDDHAAAPASGSYKIDYYIIAPASMGFMGRVASAVSSNLPERCADVALKERRPRVILFREMPLSNIHLENMLKLSQSGAIIMPAAPAFYGKPESINDLINFTTGKVFDILNIEHNLYKRWKS